MLCANVAVDFKARVDSSGPCCQRIGLVLMTGMPNFFWFWPHFINVKSWRAAKELFFGVQVAKVRSTIFEKTKSSSSTRILLQVIGTRLVAGCKNFFLGPHSMHSWFGVSASKFVDLDSVPLLSPILVNQTKIKLILISVWLTKSLKKVYYILKSTI